MHRVCRIIHTDLKPDNILLKVYEPYTQQMASEAYHWQNNNLMPPSEGHVSAKKAKDLGLKSFLKKQKKEKSKAPLDETDFKPAKIDPLYADVMDSSQAKNLDIKIADLGLACWIDNHNNDGIQARPVTNHCEFYILNHFYHFLIIHLI